jgi:hypothetical protein
MSSAACRDRHRAVGNALDYSRAGAAADDAAVDTVLTAGSARGVPAGLDGLCCRAADDP